MKICKTYNFFFLLSVSVDKTPVEALRSTKWSGFFVVAFLKKTEEHLNGLNRCTEESLATGLGLPHLVCMQYSLLSRLKEKGNARGSTEQMGTGLATATALIM